MAANAPPEMVSGNTCCLAWQGKYIGMKKRRDAFKEGIAILQKAIADANSEKANLEKKVEELLASRDIKEDESALKAASLEKEICDLKSEILSLQQRLEQNLKEKSEETELLKNQASNGEKEINEVKDLLKKETLRADNSEKEREKVCKELDKTKALIVKSEKIKPQRNELSLVKNLLASEKQKTESEMEKAKAEKRKADEYLSELEVLRTTAHKTSSDLLTLTSNLETVKKQLEFEKQKTLKERKRADMESAKAKEQMKLAEGFSKKFEIVRAKNEELKKEAELQSASSKVKFAETSTKLEEKIRLVEMNKKSAIEWKSRADDLTQQLQEAQLVTEGLKKQVQELSLSNKSTETRCVSPHKVKELEKAEMRLLKKELKFEKKCAKHSRKVTKFETFRREFQAEELGRLKLEFSSFTNRVNILDEYFSRDVEGTAGLAKVKGRTKLQTLESQKNRNGEKHCDAICHLENSPGSQEQARKFSAKLISKSIQGVSESDTGTILQLESPTGGSKKLQSSGVNSSSTSFSDGQLLASQGKGQFSVAEIAKDLLNIHPKKSNMLQKISETKKNGNLCLASNNCLQSHQKDSHEVVNEPSRKRKRMPEAVESRKHLSSVDKKKKMQIEDKLDTLQSTVVGTGCKPLEQEEALVRDKQDDSSAHCVTVSKKRKNSCKKKTITQNSLEFNRSGNIEVCEKTMCLSTAKVQDEAKLVLEGIAATDYMKLLDLDDVEEENYYRMARESLMSPYLPQVDFLDSEDTNPGRILNSATVDTINPPPSDLNASVRVNMQGQILKHFVVFSNIEDEISIIKIIHAANNCIRRCSSVSSSQWAVPEILISLKMEENLLAQEKACVFLSLLLHNFSTKIGNTLNIVDSFACLDSFSKHIYDVDIEAKDMLSELSKELLSLLQDLLSEQMVLFSVSSSETSDFISITLNGEKLDLFRRIAVTDHLVAGSAILAAICTSLDPIISLSDASFVLMYKHSHKNASALLTILHVFAYIAGDKLMFSYEHDLSISVMNSIVMFLENTEENAMFHPGNNKCPFSLNFSSLEAITFKLMQILHTFPSTLESDTEYRPNLQDFQSGNQQISLCDLLSLFELIACYTKWDWTFTNIVSPLLKMLAKPLPINLSVGIVSLLGPLASMGVDASGYENEGISKIREKLCEFLRYERTLKAGLAAQLATVSSLLKTVKLDFQTVFQGKTSSVPDKSLTNPANLVTKWFSLLSDEQRVFTTEFFANL